MIGEYENRSEGLVYLGSLAPPDADIDFAAPMNGVHAELELRYAVKKDLILSVSLVGMDASSRFWTYARIGSGSFVSGNRVRVLGVASFSSVGGRLGAHIPILRIRKWFQWQIGGHLGLHAVTTTYTNAVGVTDREPEGFRILGTMDRTEKVHTFDIMPTTRLSFRPFRWLDVNFDAFAGALFTGNEEDFLTFGYAGLRGGLGYRF